MKKLILVTTLFALALLSSMRARAAGVDYIVSGTTTVPAGGSNILNILIPVAYSSDVSVQTKFNLTGAGTSPVTFYIDSSNDAANWKSNVFQLTITADGTTPVHWITNLNVRGLPYLRLGTIHNTNATIATNLLVSTVFKRGL